MLWLKHSKFAGLDPTTSEPNIHIIDGGLDGIKMQPDMLEFFNAITLDTDNKTYLLFNVMGASDYYGANLNGDIFYEKDLILYHKTFEQGHVYENHENDDPTKSFGKIIFASYNRQMHRVELLVELDKNDPRTMRVLKMIENGRFPRVSMGTKVMFDVCTICGNKARTRADYCEHARKNLGELLPSGKRIAVENPNPRFFDMSIVTNEADKSSGYLAKVASIVTDENPFSEEEDEGIEKEVPMEAAGAEDLEDAIEGEEAITSDDEVLDEIRDTDACDEPFDLDLLDALSLHPLEKVMATMGGLGMKVKPKEFTYLALKPGLGGHGAKIIYRSHKSVGPIVIKKKASKQMFTFIKDFDPDVARLLIPEMSKRSFYPAYFKNRYKTDRIKQIPDGAIENKKLASLYSDYVNTTMAQHPVLLDMSLRKHRWVTPYIKGQADNLKEACVSNATEIDSNLWKNIGDGRKLLYIAYH
jgi:hypothetical protein